MSNRDLKEFITLRAVRAANARIMDRSSDSVRLSDPTGGTSRKAVLLTSEEIRRAGQVAFSSLKRR